MSQQARRDGFHAAAASGQVEKSHYYNGQGTEREPFLVDFQKDDPDNPMNWSQFRKWFVTTIATLSVFAVTFTSSAYSESAIEVMRDFGISTEVFVVGVSLFVLGFAIGPAGWAPLVSTSLPLSLDHPSDTQVDVLVSYP